MRTLIGALALSIVLIASAPALADTKAGVDAWNQGNYKAAVDEWRKAAIAGDADAQFDLGQAYKLGRGVPVDPAMAQSWYRKAALQGHEQAIDNYGLALFQDGKRTEALPWLEKSAARGEPRAQLVLGTMLFNGDGIERDWVRAYALLVRSSAAGLPQGSQTLAEMDKYIPADQRQQGIALARQYEQQVARAGYPPDGASASARGPSAPRLAVVPSVAPERTSADTPGPAKSKLPAATALPAHSSDAPGGKPTPRRAVAPAGGWRIQLGAFRDEANAKALWERLKDRVPPLASLQPFLRRAGALTKLQAGPIKSSAEAGRFCAAVKQAGTACLLVEP